MYFLTSGQLATPRVRMVWYLSRSKRNDSFSWDGRNLLFSLPHMTPPLTWEHYLQLGSYANPVSRRREAPHRATRCRTVALDAWSPLRERTDASVPRAERSFIAVVPID